MDRTTELLAAALAGDLQHLRDCLPVTGDPASFPFPLGVTPLMAAAAGGHEQVVELLLERGFSPVRRDVLGRSAAAYARRAGHTHLAARLDVIVNQEQALR
jgi:uncharacterized protein